MPPLKTYSPREVADLFGTASDNWLREGARTGKYPHIRPGRCVRFTDKHIEQILAILEQPVRPVVYEAAIDGSMFGATKRSQAHHRKPRARRA